MPISGGGASLFGCDEVVQRRAKGRDALAWRSAWLTSSRSSPFWSWLEGRLPGAIAVALAWRCEVTPAANHCAKRRGIVGRACRRAAAVAAHARVLPYQPAITARTASSAAATWTG